MSEFYRSLIDFGAWHLAESTTFALAVFSLVFAFKLQNGSSRFLFYQIALLKFLVPLGVLVSLFLNSEALQATPFATLTFEALSRPSSLIPAQSFSNWPLVSIIIWGIGVTILLISITIGCYRTRTLRTARHTPSPQTTKRIHDTMRSAGFTDAKTLPIIEDEEFSSIGLVGFFKPRIIVNPAFLEALSNKELIAAIRHELAHARRRDNLWRLVHEAIVALFWFHPLVWVLRDKLRTECEHACDEFALSQGEEPQSYAKCLVKAASLNTQYTSNWVTGFSTADLKKRIRKVITFQNRKESKIKTLLMHLSIWCILGIVTLSSSSLNAADPATDDKVYSLSGIDKKPVPLEMITPLYPKSMSDQKIDGRVVVEFVIDKFGETHAVKAIKSTHEAFEEPSIATVSSSKFSPAEKGGKPVNSKVRIPILFKAEL